MANKFLYALWRDVVLNPKFGAPKLVQTFLYALWRDVVLNVRRAFKAREGHVNVSIRPLA